MEVGESLSKVFAHTVLTPLPCVGREHADVLNVNTGNRIIEVVSLGMTEEKAEMSIFHRLLRRDGNGIFLPFLALYSDVVG